MSVRALSDGQFHAKESRAAKRSTKTKKPAAPVPDMHSAIANLMANRSVVRPGRPIHPWSEVSPATKKRAGRK